MSRREVQEQASDMKAKSFIEVLEQQIREDLRAEIRKEVEAELRVRARGETIADSTTGANSGAFERLETWLASRMNRATFASETQARRKYGTPRSRANAHTATNSNETKQESQPKAEEAAHEARTVEEICALELLRRHGARIGDRFTASELKTAWRKAALQTHPDRFTQADAVTQARMSASFREITEAYELLQTRFDFPLAA